MCYRRILCYGHGMKTAPIILAFSILLVSACSAEPVVKGEYPVHEPTRSTTLVSYQSKEGMQLAQALAKNDKKTASRLLQESDNKLANTKYRSSGCFHQEEGGVIFLTLRNPEMLTLLLDHGANIESRDWNDQTPLLDATFDALPETVALLVKRGANPNAVRSIEPMRICNWDGKRRVCKNMPEQKLTALNVAQINLDNHKKNKGLTDSEQKIRDYSSIIKILEPITGQSKPDQR